jgi:hypothetical protein
MRVTVYARKRGATVVARVPTYGGEKRVKVRVNKRELEQLLRNARVLRRGKRAVTARLGSTAAARLLLRIPDASKTVPHWYADRVLKSAVRRDARVRAEVWWRALEKVRDPELARAYVRAWLKSRNRELPASSRDASRVAEQYWKLVWKMGADRYVVQVAPWE